MKKLIVIALVLVVAAGGAAWWWVSHRGAGMPVYRTAEVKRGDVVSAITATGTLEPEEVVDVGAQVAGMIVSLGTDANGRTIDYDSQVAEGTILANIDPSLYESDVAQQTANLQNAQASVARAQADVVQSQAKAEQAQRDWERAQKLGPSELLAQSAYDAYKATFDAAVAAVGVSEAAVTQAQAMVSLAQAQLDRSKRNLGYCVITSPVKGVIIDRRVNIGQTVVSSLNAPSLFLIAKDLTKMQVWASVNEADVSSIHAGQTVRFTVDAIPGRTFNGQVIKVRLNAAMTQNVVTYTSEIEADNGDGALLPYLTANVNFIVAERNGVLTVPNAALHWNPNPAQIDPAYASAGSPASAPLSAAIPSESPSGASAATGGATGATGATGTTGATGGSGAPGQRPRGNRQGGGGGRRGAGGMTPGMVWVPSTGSYVRPIKVLAGVTDGATTEIQSRDLSEGTAVVVGEQTRQQAAATQGTNPFAPPMFRGRGRSGAVGGTGGSGGSGGAANTGRGGR